MPLLYMQYRRILDVRLCYDTEHHATGQGKGQLTEELEDGCSWLEFLVVPKQQARGAARDSAAKADSAHGAGSDSAASSMLADGDDAESAPVAAGSARTSDGNKADADPRVTCAFMVGSDEWRAMSTHMEATRAASRIGDLTPTELQGARWIKQANLVKGSEPDLACFLAWHYHRDRSVPLPGDVGVVTGGPPCQEVSMHGWMPGGEDAWVHS